MNTNLWFSRSCSLDMIPDPYTVLPPTLNPACQQVEGPAWCGHRKALCISRDTRLATRWSRYDPGHPALCRGSHVQYNVICILSVYICKLSWPYTGGGLNRKGTDCAGITYAAVFVRNYFHKGLFPHKKQICPEKVEPGAELMPRD